MNSKNENYFSSTTIYVNSDQLSDSFIDPFRTDEQYLNDKINQLNQMNDLYQNVSELDDDDEILASQITDSECNKTSSTSDHSTDVQLIPKIPPPIKPRLSLLTKKLKQKELTLEQKFEQIDENSVLKEQENKFEVNKFKENKLIDEFHHLNAKHHSLDSNENDLYLSNEFVQLEEQLNTTSNDETNQFTNKLSAEKINEMNRNTYISNSDVNEQRFSNNYSELEEPIYSDIIFDESKRRCNTAESFYDFPSSTNSIKFTDLQPPPLPPRTAKNSTVEKISKTESDVKSELANETRLKNQIENDLNSAKICSDFKLNQQNDLKIDLKNELNNHFKTENFLNLSNSLPHNSSSLNSLLNNASFSTNNPFLTAGCSQNDCNSDLKLDERKEHLNSMPKDHFQTLNKTNQLKESSKLNKDDLLMFERQLDEFNSNSLSKSKKSLMNSIIQQDQQGYGKINRIKLEQSDDEDEGSLKSSFSFMDSQINSSSNDTFSYKSFKSNRSNNSIKSTNKLIKPTVGIITPFLVRTPNNSSTGQLNKNQFTVQLNDEFKSTLNNKESSLFAKKFSTNQFDEFNDHKNFNSLEKSNDLKFDHQTQQDLNQLQQVTAAASFNQQMSNLQNQFNENIENSSETSNYQNTNSIKEFLYKTGPNRKQFHKRWCVLSESALFYYNEEKLNLNDLKSQAKGHIELNDILFLNVIPDLICLATNRFRKVIKSIKSKVNNVELHQFNIGLNSDNGRLHLLATESANRRQLWLDLLAYRIKPKLKPSSIVYKNIDACGYLNVKIGLTGVWFKSWVVLQKRELNILILDMNTDYSNESDKTDLITIDLRKVMTIGYNQNAQIKQCETVYEAGPLFFLNRRYETVLYFQADFKMHSEEWFNSIELNHGLPENGVFEDQLLAPNNIPIAVEKCLNFISTYNGIGTKQIYKASGDDSYTRIIVENLKSNSLFDWHIRPEDGFTVLDVSDALKIYLKSFPECLLTEKLYQDFLKLNFCTKTDERLNRLKVLLKKLPIVNYNTLKKLICHFTLFIENCKENEMNLDSLAYAICPHLIFSKISAQPEISLSLNLFKDLVNSYIWLFDLNSSELDKERKIENSLKELRKFRIKQDKDELLVGVYLFNKSWGRCVNVPINSTMTADDLLFYVTKIANLKESPTKLCVCEVVSNHELERVIHYSEHIQQITLGWTVRWSQQDAKSNYLLIKLNDLYEELDDYFDKGLNSLPVTIFNEIKFSDECNKNFRKVFLEFSNLKFNIYKDARMKTKSLATWALEDVRWYLGAERKRNAPSKFCITLLDKDQPIQRQKELIISRVISFNTGEELARFLAAIICSECSIIGLRPLIHSINCD